jgi:DNA-directed RNA polymerase sigma subunit (sigma70/sigma32)
VLPRPVAGEVQAGDDQPSFKTLTYREREIIKLRHGIGDGYTYTIEEVDRIFKVTRERVRQVEAKAIRKLQHPVRARKLEGFCREGCRGKGMTQRRAAFSCFSRRI